MYVRLYEKQKRTETDNPTIGIILCSQNDKTVVEYSMLSDSKQLFSSQYKLYMPTEEELKRIVQSWFLSCDDKKESVSLAVGVEPTPQGETLPPFRIMALPTIHFPDAKIHLFLKMSTIFFKKFWLFCLGRQYYVTFCFTPRFGPGPPAAKQRKD